MIDEETGEEGFLSQFNGTCYTPKDEWATAWDAALVAGHFLRKKIMARELEKERESKTSAENSAQENSRAKDEHT